MADCQGGNDANSAHAQSPCAEENGESQVKSIINTLGKQTEVFNQTTQSIKTLAEAIAVLRTDVREIKKRQSTEDDGPCKKKPRIISLGEHEENSEPELHCEEVSPWLAIETQQSPPDEDGSSDNENEQENGNDLSDFMKETPQPDEDKDFVELEEYFTAVEDTGPAVNEQLARIANLALRGGDNTEDLAKLENYSKEYKRPENIENLQIPKVDDTIWRGLTSAVKSKDFLLQRAVSSYNLVLVPIIQALETLKNGGPDLRQTTQGKIMDAFKILCLLVKSTNAARTEKLKADILPKYRGVCNNKASATNLLGDNLQEALKKFDGAKVNITKSKPFLGKGFSTNHNPKPQNRPRQVNFKQNQTAKPHYSGQHRKGQYHNSNNNNRGFQKRGQRRHQPALR